MLFYSFRALVPVFRVVREHHLRVVKKLRVLESCRHLSHYFECSFWRTRNAGSLCYIRAKREF